MKKKKRGISLESRKSMYGRLFVLPWAIGFALFFLIPLIQSVWFAFSKVEITTNGFLPHFLGLKNFDYVLNVQPDYMKNLTSSLRMFVTSVPIIVILSFILGIILNQKFRGRLLARAVFFIPAIIASGVVMNAFSIDNLSGSAMAATSDTNVYFSGAIDFEAILNDLGLPVIMTEPIADYISQISSLIWNCGIQILLIIAGLQSIPQQLYEVSRVEGATSWEEFWFITFPMMTNILLVVIAYTIIDVLTDKNNPVMVQATNLIMQQQNYDQSAAMLWIYFPIIGVVVAAAFFVINRTMVRKWA